MDSIFLSSIEGIGGGGGDESAESNALTVGRRRIGKRVDDVKRIIVERNDGTFWLFLFLVVV